MSCVAGGKNNLHTVLLLLSALYMYTYEHVLMYILSFECGELGIKHHLSLVTKQLICYHSFNTNENMAREKREREGESLINTIFYIKDT